MTGIEFKIFFAEGRSRVRVTFRGVRIRVRVRVRDGVRSTSDIFERFGLRQQSRLERTFLERN